MTEKNPSDENSVQSPSEQSQVIAAWLIQIARYWNLDALAISLQANDLQAEWTQSIEVNSALTIHEWLKHLTTENLKASAETNKLAEYDLQHHCLLMPLDTSLTTKQLSAGLTPVSIWRNEALNLQMIICGEKSEFPDISEQRIKSHCKIIQQQITHSPEKQVKNVECLDQQEFNKIVHEWNDTARNYPIDQCVHQLFHKQCLKTPDQTAIRFKDQPISYRELDIKANQFAQYLFAQNVTSGDIVGLCLTRTPLWPIGMLAIWKVGAVFLPLEADLPDERLSYIINDSNCQLVVTEQSLESRFTDSSARISTINLNSLSDYENIEHEAQTSPDSLAYIIYTSGTTGQPKGVKVNHRGLSNLAYCQFERMKFSPNQRILQAVSFNFDASLHDVTFALLSGSILCIADENERLPGPAMVEFLRTEKINFITLPPSALETLPFEDLPDLHTILAVGEVCSASLVNQWVGKKQFYNGYGPTETTVGALIGECFAGESKPTIGTALANVRIYILDSRMKPVPIGAIGEIYVGGVGVAQGYVNQPERTKQTFIPDPYSSEASNKLYKTGDKARFLEDGRVDFIGRVDKQVKIAGRRIEIEEIEARCKAFDKVKSAAVIVHQENNSSKILRAFILLNSSFRDTSPQDAINQLKLYLAKHLPTYMLPNQFFLLQEMPSSINGKLERKSLENIDKLYLEINDDIKQSLSLQGLVTIFKSIGNNIYIPICYYANKSNENAENKIQQEFNNRLDDFAHPFSIFSLGQLPEIKSQDDIEQLPVPTQFQTKWQTQKFKPSTNSQKILAGIWQQHLNINQVYLDDNFVELGGESITAVKIILAVQKQTNVELSGADLFGSDFGYCAARLESEITGNPMQLENTGKSSVPEPVNAFFFGHHDNQLYGVYHPTSELNQEKQAILFCPAITNDYQRSRPLLQQLASKLSSAGYPCMRFDYYGCGDSRGSSQEMTLERCKENILASIQELKIRSGCQKIILFGIRFGATLITNISIPSEVEQLILFDPIETGFQFLQNQRQLHLSLLKDPNHFQWRKKNRLHAAYEEILGQHFSHPFVDELKQLSLSFGNDQFNTESIISKIKVVNSRDNPIAALEKINPININDDCGWRATNKIDTTIVAGSLYHSVFDVIQGGLS